MRSVTKSEYTVPLKTHNQTLFHSNIAHRLHFEVADFGALGTVTHLGQAHLMYNRMVLSPGRVAII